MSTSKALRGPTEAQMVREWERWQMVCGQLQQAGAVKPDDIKADQGDDSTPGRRLLMSIRLWGESLAVIRNEARQ